MTCRAYILAQVLFVLIALHLHEESPMPGTGFDLDYRITPELNLYFVRWNRDSGIYGGVYMGLQRWHKYNYFCVRIWPKSSSVDLWLLRRGLLSLWNDEYLWSGREAWYPHQKAVVQP
jgi:hypothetical protein